MTCTHEPKIYSKPDGAGNLNEHSLCEHCAKEFAKICAEKVRVESAIKNKNIVVIRAKPKKRPIIVKRITKCLGIKIWNKQ